MDDVSNDETWQFQLVNYYFSNLRPSLSDTQLLSESQMHSDTAETGTGMTDSDATHPTRRVLNNMLAVSFFFLSLPRSSSFSRFLFLP